MRLTFFPLASRNNERMRLHQAALESDLSLKTSELLAANTLAVQLKDELKGMSPNEC